MPLTDQQIERYSRQIIVLGIGGLAQERLLASSVMVVAEPADVERVLPYLGGAGIGRIVLFPVGDPETFGEMLRHLRDLNPDVAGSLGERATPPCDLTFALISSARSLRAAARVARAHPQGAFIIARLDRPAQVAVLPASPPCILCADADLLGPAHKGDAAAGVATMAAATEAFKLLANPDRHSQPRLITFDGYTCEARVLDRRPGVRCDCEAR
jgi:hypothetical protein